MNTCKYCGAEVPQSPTKGGRVKEYCNESCRAKWRYKNDPFIMNRDTYTEQKQRAFHSKWKAIQERGGKCIKCGESNPVKLCFHHRDPSQKTLKLDGRTFANRKYQTIKEELDKCDLMCHNCHHELHWGDGWVQFLEENKLV
tara:strand:- start:1334 stop:1759 length:426 start_codon:yes stop_codon:yes gene_type:complete